LAEPVKRVLGAEILATSAAPACAPRSRRCGWRKASSPDRSGQPQPTFPG